MPPSVMLDQRRCAACGLIIRSGAIIAGRWWFRDCCSKSAGLESFVMDPMLFHASLMIVAWLVLPPAGAMIARFCKVTPHQDWPSVVDRQLWWWLHRILQYSGVACALAGFFIAVNATG